MFRSRVRRLEDCDMNYRTFNRTLSVFCLAIGISLLSIPAWSADFCVNTAADLQNALTIAQNNGEDDIIRVQQGTYYGNFGGTFTDAHSLTLEGGYNHRRCKKREVDQNNTVLDGQNNVRVLELRSSGGASNFSIDGLTIKNGCHLQSIIQIETTGIVIVNNSSIIDNNCNDVGKAMVILGAYEVNLLNNSILRNSNGGVNIVNEIGFEAEFVNLERNLVENNIAGGQHGAGIRIYGANNVNVDSNIFNANLGADGGGLAIDRGKFIKMTNCVFNQNRVSNFGGGVIILSHKDLLTFDLSATNNTFYRNSGSVSNGGGMMIGGLPEDSNILIHNNIFWQNSNQSGNDFSIYNSSIEQLSILNNDFDQGTDGTYIQVPPISFDPSNLDKIDPLFIDPVNYDNHLKPDSPCIDAGINAGVYVDFDGDIRPQGLGFDIGADEYVSTSDSLDLGIARFSTSNRVSLSRNKNTVEISLAVLNNGTIDEEGSATVVGIQNSIEIYRETISVSNPIGNGQSVYDFPSYKPTLAGNILWTVKLEDGDPDLDEAVSYTTVVP